NRRLKGRDQVRWSLLGNINLAVNKLNPPTPLRHNCTVDNLRLSEPTLIHTTAIRIGEYTGKGKDIGDQHCSLRSRLYSWTTTPCAPHFFSHKIHPITTEIMTSAQKLACEECRRRRLKCDRRRPECDRCLESNGKCIYLTEARKRGPKKGQIHALRAQVSELQKQLSNGPTQGQQPSPESICGSSTIGRSSLDHDTNPLGDGLREIESTQITSPINLLFDNFTPFTDCDPWLFPGTSDSTRSEKSLLDPVTGSCSSNLTDFCSWPTTTSISNLSDVEEAELEELFFVRVYPWAPIIDKAHYLAWTSQSTISSATACLRKAVFNIAAVTSSRYRRIGESLLQETRQELQSLHGVAEDLPWSTGPVELAQVQAWLLLGLSELIFWGRQRSLPDISRACLLVQRYHSQALVGPSNALLSQDCAREQHAAHREEQCRTFWLAYILDRCLDGSDGWTCTIPETTILQPVPASEMHFPTSQTANPVMLHELFGESAEETTLSPFSESIALATLHSRSLTHKRIAASFASVDDQDQHFWARHNWLTNAIDRRARMLHRRLNRSKGSSGANSLEFFNQMLMQMIIIHIGAALKLQPRTCTPNERAMAVDWVARVRTASSEIVQLVQGLTRLDYVSLIADALAHCPMDDEQGFPGFSIGMALGPLKRLRHIHASAEQCLSLYQASHMVEP
ncbi:fungal specific transcription factor domain protein, partial [Teratosphaeria destructans]